jgi:hypothetical protein
MGVTLPALVTSKLTFDTRSNKLVAGEQAIVFNVEQKRGEAWEWTMLSIDRPRFITHVFTSPPERVFKSWLILAA